MKGKKIFVEKIKGDGMKGKIGIEGIDIELSKKLKNKAKRRNCKDPKVWLVI